MATKKKLARKKINYIAVALDVSGSMSHLLGKATQVCNEIFATAKVKSEEEGQETYVALVTFGSLVRVIFQPVNVKYWKPIEQPALCGMTAMFDGVGKAAEILKAAPASASDDVSYLVVTIGDGLENQSQTWSAHKIKQLMLEDQDRWTYAFNLPIGSGQTFARQFGIPEENIREWEANATGIQQTSVATQSAMGNYFTARSAGATNVRNFYEVTANLDSLKTNVVKAKLDDISNKFKPLEVPKEMAIKDFVESKGYAYVTGAAFYELSKPEKVQPNKDVLIMERGKKAIWGGDEARKLIGLPTDGVSHAKLTPGNLSQYRILVKSTSHNRILVRGTLVLLDITKTVPDKPTWEEVK